MKNVEAKVVDTSERVTWSKAWDFIISCAGLTVGLGNIWRFPYLCFENGGGAFLIPYLISAIFLGLPMLLLEISFGQSIRKGLTKTWETVPLFKGIAFANAIVLYYGNLTYSAIFSWILKYFVNSFKAVLPWATCTNSWNTRNCIAYNGQPSSLAPYNTTNVPANFSLDLNSTLLSTFIYNSANTSVSASEEFLNHEVWGISSGIEEVGNLRSDLVLYMAIMWVLVYFALFKGINWSAKVAYLTATLPIGLIVTILVRGVTLDGAGSGIKYYLTPDLDKLKDVEVWISAATQVFFSFVISTGAMVTMGSFNKKNHNFYRDSVLIVVCNTVTSFLSGFAVFSVLGFMAKYQNTTIELVARSGPGLVFIAYPQALTMLPLPQFWNVLFFLTLLLLGFDSLFIFIESFLVVFLDAYPRFGAHRFGRQILLVFICVLFFLSDLTMLTEGGIYVFEMLNTYAMTGWCIFATSFFELLAVSWCYGAERHWRDIEKMVGRCVTRPVVMILWKYIGPVVCLAITIYYITVHSPLKYGSYIYPVWAQVLANVISLTSVIPIPAYALYILITSKKSFHELIRGISSPQKLDNGLQLLDVKKSLDEEQANPCLTEKS